MDGCFVCGEEKDVLLTDIYQIALFNSMFISDTVFQRIKGQIVRSLERKSQCLNSLMIMCPVQDSHSHSILNFGSFSYEKNEQKNESMITIFLDDVD